MANDSKPPASSWFSPDWHRGLPALAIIAATLFFYAPALQGGFLWDDDTCISANPSLRTWQGLWNIWFVGGATEQYYPLTFSAFWFEYHLWGLNTVGYHVVTVLLHGVAAVLLWQVLASLRVRGALLAGAIFALHPVNVMSVAWMTELKNTLSGVLVLGSCWAYVRFAGLGEYERAGTDPKTKIAWLPYILALVLFQLAMLAKTAVGFLPVTLFLVLWWQKKKVTGRDALWVLPMAAITIGMGALTIYIEQHSGGASGPDFQLNFIERILVSGRSFWFYLGKLLLPCNLTFIYPRWQVDAGAWWQYLYPLTALGLLVTLWMFRARLGKGVCVAFFHYYLTTSLLVLMVVLYMMRFSFVSDHWQYFGSMAMLGLFAAGITAGLAHLGLEGKASGTVLKLLLLAMLGILTWRQCGMYSDAITLFQTTLERNPACWMAYNNLGNIYSKRGQDGEAIQQFQKALQIKTDDVEALNDLGLILCTKGQADKGIALYQTALKFLPRDANAHYNLADALLQKGQVDEAISHYQMALAANPNFADAHNNLGIALFQKRQLDEAITQFQLALQISPDYAKAHNNLGWAFLQKNRIEEAITQFQTALQINPQYAGAHKNLGNAYAHRGQLDEAMVQFQQALQIEPNNAEAHNDLGIALFQKGDVAGAIVQFQESVRLNPGNPSMQTNLAKAMETAHPNAVHKVNGSSTSPAKK